MMKDCSLNPGSYHSNELRQMGFAHIGDNVSIGKNCTVIGMENISIADNVRIDGGTVIVAARGHLRLGSYIHIGGLCHLSCAGGISMDDFSGLSQGVSIYSATDDYSGESLTNPLVPDAFLNVTRAPVALGRHVIIGSNSVILPGVTIGQGSAVGALALVTKSIAEWEIHAGNPARRLKTRSKGLLEKEKAFLNK